MTTYWYTAYDVITSIGLVRKGRHCICSKDEFFPAITAENTIKEMLKKEYGLEDVEISLFLVQPISSEEYYKFLHKFN